MAKKGQDFSSDGFFSVATSGEFNIGAYANTFAPGPGEAWSLNANLPGAFGPPSDIGYGMRPTRGGWGPGAPLGPGGPMGGGFGGGPPRAAAPGGAVPKPPFMALNERVPGCGKDLVWEDLTMNKQRYFRCNLTIDSQTFIGEGWSKRDAKNDLAVKALEVLPKPSSRRFAGIKRPRSSMNDFSGGSWLQPPGSQPRSMSVSQSPDESSLVEHMMELCRKRSAEEAQNASAKKSTDKKENVAESNGVEKMETDEAGAAEKTEGVSAGGDVKWMPVFSFERLKDENEKTLNMFLATVTVNGQTLTTKSKSKHAAKITLTKKILQEVLNVDVSEFEQKEKKDIDERIYGKPFSSAIHYLCDRYGYPLGKSTEETVKGEDDQPKLFKATWKINDIVYNGESPEGKKTAKKGMCRTILKEAFGFTDERINELEASSRIAKLQPMYQQKPALAMLHELCQARGEEYRPKYEDLGVKQSEDNTGSARPKYGLKLTVKDKQFTAWASSKKEVKLTLATDALKEVFNVDLESLCSDMYASYLPLGMDVPAYGMDPLLAKYTSPLADRVATLIKSKREELNEEFMPKELAGFVVVMGENAEKAEVVSLATGTKCISGGKISAEGQAINDCHAEVLARRGLLLYLYNQLSLVTQWDKADQSIFENRTDGPGYKLKEHVEIHLYISSAPCGDARIFSPTDKPVFTETFDPKRSRRNRALLRVKIEGGMGTIPLISDNVKPQQAWDAILGGERILCMSCSDKILKWNVCGIQGSLLSHYVEPVYLKSIILGSLFHQEHLTRACFARLGKDYDTKDKLFRLNSHDLYTVTEPESRSTVKPTVKASDWVMVPEQVDVEVLSGETGRTNEISAGLSRLCKRKLFEKFLELYHKLQPMVEHKPGQLPLTYLSAKKESEAYNKVKSNLLEYVERIGYGKWAKKPEEMDNFELAIKEHVEPLG